MKLPSTGNKTFDYNFNQICKEIDALQKAVNPPQVGSTQGKKLDTGNVRFIKGLDGSGYLEVGGDDGVYTTFQGGLQLKGEELPYAYLKKLSVDNFYAKNIFAQSMRTTNGNVILSDSGIVAGIISNNKFTVKNPDGTLLNPFRVGDLLYTAKFGNDHSITIKELRLVVTAISGLTVTYTKSAESGTGIPAQTGNLESGDTIVRLGNNNLTTNPDRGSVMILVTSDIRNMGTGLKNYAPYIKMLSNIDSYNDYFNGLPIVQLGNLGIITDTDFGTGAFLTPSTGTIGLYTTAGFFKGKLSLSDEDLLGDIAIGKTYKSSTDPIATNVIREGDLWIDSSTTNRFRTQVWIGNPSDDVSPGAWTAYLPGIWDAPSGGGLQITADYMGYYDSGSFKTYIRDNGYFEFKGDANNYVSWLGTTLDIKGNITVTNPEDFVEQNPATYVQNADPKLSTTVYEGNLWYDLDGTPAKWYRWVGLPSNATPTPGAWVEQLWGTYITGSGIYTGTITAGQITTGTLDAQTITLGTTTSDGVLQSYDYVLNTSGWKIAKGFAEFNNGNINFNTGGYTLSINSPAIDFTDTTFGTSSYIEHRITSGNKADLYLNASTGGRITLSASEIFMSGNIATWGGAVVDAPSSGYFHYNGTKFVWDTPTLSESDPIYTTSTWYTTTNNSSNWNTAYTWVNNYGSGQSAWTAAANWVASYGWTDYIRPSTTGYNNSNWDTAYNDKINSASFGTTTGVLTLTQQDSGTITVDLDGRWIATGDDITAGDVKTGSGGNAPAYFDGSGYLALGSVSSPITMTAGAIGIQVASSSQNGYLSSTDWSTFNGKANAFTGYTGEISIIDNLGGENVLTFSNGILTNFSYIP